MTTGGGGDSTNLTWEKFEELAKVAFVADPHADTRFFLKTRVTPAAKAAKGQKKPSKNVIKIVARVSTRPRKQVDSGSEKAQSGGQQQVTAQSIAYQTPLVSHLSRLTRLLRFVMQEVLGPMKPAVLTAAAGTGVSQAPQSQSQASAAPSDKSKKKKKKGGKK
ncbi:hypothetical protein Gpo141_00002618 [Globisporangium polare]